MNRTLILLFAFLFILFSCKKEGPQKDTFSSVQSLYVEYISSYTQGYIPSTSEIRLKLSKSVKTAEIGKEVGLELFSFDPKIAGKAYWEDNRTIVFKPDERLISGKEYQVVFSLSKLMDIPKDRELFKFVFNCIPQNFEVHLTGMSLYDANNLDRVKILGKIQTADKVSIDEISSILKAKQNGADLNISVEESEDNVYPFVIEQVSRTEKKEKVSIEWDGSPLKVDKKGRMDYEIPSLSEYTVTAVTVIRSQDSYISVLFSDPVDEKQNLRGLVRLSMGTNPRVVVELNEIKVYPTSRMTGSVKLVIDKALKNKEGDGLTEDFETNLQFSQIKPEVKLATNSGVIMPSTDGLIIPFEAVSLDAVDLTIVRIFENNILQYLQTRNFSDSYEGEIRRVGRPVVKKKILLNTSGITDLNTWNRYTIDISDYVNVETGAIYQVRFNFKKSYSEYFCESSENEDSFDEEDTWEFEESNNWDNYQDYYYYDWENRDNPCKRAYYSQRKEVKKLIFGSDLGLVAKMADQGELIAFATHLITAKPLSDVQMEVYDFQQQLIGSGNTDSNGKISLKVDGKPYFLVGKTDNQFAYLKLDDGSSLSLSNFNVSGSRIQKGLKGYLYGERGVWRPGDTLHLSFILEDVNDRLPEGHPVILKLYNPLGQLYTRTVQTSSVKDLYTFNVSTPKEAQTGKWNAEVTVGGAKFTRSLNVETVKPNRLKISLDFNSERLIKDEDQSATLTARWLHGAIAKNLKAEYEVVMVPTKTTFSGYENLNFDDPSKEFYSEQEKVFSGRLDQEGKARINIDLSVGKEAPGMLNAIFRGKVFEEGGDFSVDKTTVPFVPYDQFAGVQLPEGDQRGMLVTDKDHKVRIVTVDSKGQPVTSKVEVKLFKLEWKWWWDNSYESTSNYTSQYYSKTISSKEVSTVNGEGSYSLKVEYPAWGRYFLQVRDIYSGHSSGKIFYIDWPGWSGRQKRGELGGVTMLDFGVEKNKVSVGEPIRISIPSSEGGRALVSLETGSRVLETFWVDTDSENTTIEFEATAEMAPNVYANISLIQPHSQTLNDLPVRMYGIQAIEVEDSGTSLKPKMTLPDKLSPGETFNVEISESEGNAMAYTIAVVEDGLLDLTKYKTPDPHSAFYTREALGVKTWDVYDDVIGAYGGEIEKLLALGGDMEVEGPEENEANRFKPVVIFKGPFYLEAGKKARHSFTMPQYIGSVRAMLVAGHNGRYGSVDKTVPVKQPLMILATLPRVAGPTEDIELPVNIFSADPNIRNVVINVETSGKLKIAGTSSKTVRFDGEGDQVTYFKLKASPELGKGKVTVTATSGSLKAEYDVELQVRPSNPMISQVKEQILEGGQTLELNYEPLGLLGTNEGMLEISSLPPLNLEQRMSYLIQYPHGCIEQSVSSVFAQLYLEDLVEVDETRSEKIQSNINAAIEQLRNFQLTNGSFAYWPGQSTPSYWGTNYAGHFLLEAKNKGYNVPKDMLKNWGSFQRKEAKNYSKGSYSDHLIQTYRLYTLSLAGTPAFGAMNRLKESSNLNVRTKWSLASAYAAANYDDAANDIIQGLTTDLKDYREMSGTYGSTQRDQAIMLEVMARLGKQTEAFTMIQKISKVMGDSKKWMSTQTTAYCLIGIAEFARKFPATGDIELSAVVSGSTFRVDGEKYLNQITMIEPDKKSNIKLDNKGDNPLFIRVVRNGIPLEGGEVASSSNISLKVNYQDMNGQAINESSIPQGTDFVAEVTVTNPGLRGDYEELAITQIFPSGWEIINTRLDGVSQYYEKDIPEYRDIKDDRVLTYFDLEENKSVVYRVLLNASYQGKYYLPAVSVEAMYDKGISSNTVGKWVNVTIQE